MSVPGKRSSGCPGIAEEGEEHLGAGGSGWRVVKGMIGKKCP